ncbi:hypothetical protein [Bacillus sp. 2205SS5-2]|uniref:hypothetical protein n=1 Tax=Bacillus sp. 2205SS5-2 TaxID=3109031 RepID=UPI00300572E7
MKRPLGVSLISCFYVFGSLVLLYTAFFYEPLATEVGIAEVFAVPAIPEQPMRVLVALFTFIMIFGYFSLKSWGFWVMLLYSLIFGLINLSLISPEVIQPFLGNIIMSSIVILYTISVKPSFLQ